MMMMIMTNCVTVFLISCLPDRKINRPESGLPSAISSARSRQPLAARHQTCSSGRGQPSVGQRYLASYGPTAGRLHFFTPVRTGISLPFTYPPRGRYKRGHTVNLGFKKVKNTNTTRVLSSSKSVFREPRTPMVSLRCSTDLQLAGETCGIPTRLHSPPLDASSGTATINVCVKNF